MNAVQEEQRQQQFGPHAVSPDEFSAFRGALIEHGRQRYDGVYESVSQLKDPNNLEHDDLLAGAEVAARYNPQMLGFNDAEEALDRPITAASRSLIMESAQAAEKYMLTLVEEGMDKREAMNRAGAWYDMTLGNLSGYRPNASADAKGAFNGTLRALGYSNSYGKAVTNVEGRKIFTELERGIDYGNGAGAFASTALSGTMIGDLISNSVAGLSSGIPGGDFITGGDLMNKALANNLRQEHDRVLSEGKTTLARGIAPVLGFAEMMGSFAVGGVYGAAAYHVMRGGYSDIMSSKNNTGIVRYFTGNEEQDSRAAQWALSRAFDFGTYAFSMGVTGPLAEGVGTGIGMLARGSGVMKGALPFVIAPVARVGIDTAFDVALDYGVHRVASSILEPSGLTFTTAQMRQFGDVRGIANDALYRLAMRVGGAVVNRTSADYFRRGKDTAQGVDATNYKWYTKNFTGINPIAARVAAMTNKYLPSHLAEIADAYDSTRHKLGRGDGTFAEDFKSGKISSTAYLAWYLEKEYITNNLINGLYENGDMSPIRLATLWVKPGTELVYRGLTGRSAPELADRSRPFFQGRTIRELMLSDSKISSTGTTIGRGQVAVNNEGSPDDIRNFAEFEAAFVRDRADEIVAEGKKSKQEAIRQAASELRALHEENYLTRSFHGDKVAPIYERAFNDILGENGRRVVNNVRGAVEGEERGIKQEGGEPSVGDQLRAQYLQKMQEAGVDKTSAVKINILGMTEETKEAYRQKMEAVSRTAEEEALDLQKYATNRDELELFFTLAEKLQDKNILDDPVSLMELRSKMVELADVLVRENLDALETTLKDSKVTEEHKIAVATDVLKEVNLLQQTFGHRVPLATQQRIDEVFSTEAYQGSLNKIKWNDVVFRNSEAVKRIIETYEEDFGEELTPDEARRLIIDTPARARSMFSTLSSMLATVDTSPSEARMDAFAGHIVTEEADTDGKVRYNVFGARFDTESDAINYAVDKLLEAQIAAAPMSYGKYDENYILSVLINGEEFGVDGEALNRLPNEIIAWHTNPDARGRDAVAPEEYIISTGPKLQQYLAVNVQRMYRIFYSETGSTSDAANMTRDFLKQHRLLGEDSIIEDISVTGNRLNIQLARDLEYRDEADVMEFAGSALSTVSNPMGKFNDLSNDDLGFLMRKRYNVGGSAGLDAGSVLDKINRSTDSFSVPEVIDSIARSMPTPEMAADAVKSFIHSVDPVTARALTKNGDIDDLARGAVLMSRAKRSVDNTLTILKRSGIEADIVSALGTEPRLIAYEDAGIAEFFSISLENLDLSQASDRHKAMRELEKRNIFPIAKRGNNKELQFVRWRKVAGINGVTKTEEADYIRSGLERLVDSRVVRGDQKVLSTAIRARLNSSRFFETTWVTAIEDGGIKRGVEVFFNGSKSASDADDRTWNGLINIIRQHSLEQRQRLTGLDEEYHRPGIDDVFRSDELLNQIAVRSNEILDRLREFSQDIFELAQMKGQLDGQIIQEKLGTELTQLDLLQAFGGGKNIINVLNEMVSKAGTVGAAANDVERQKRITDMTEARDKISGEIEALRARLKADTIRNDLRDAEEEVVQRLVDEFGLLENMEDRAILHEFSQMITKQLKQLDKNAKEYKKFGSDQAARKALARVLMYNMNALYEPQASLPKRAGGFSLGGSFVTRTGELAPTIKSSIDEFYSTGRTAKLVIMVTPEGVMDGQGGMWSWLLDSMSSTTGKAAGSGKLVYNGEFYGKINNTNAHVYDGLSLNAYHVMRLSNGQSAVASNPRGVTLDGEEYGVLTIDQIKAAGPGFLDRFGLTADVVEQIERQGGAPHLVVEFRSAEDFADFVKGFSAHEVNRSRAQEVAIGMQSTDVSEVSRVTMKFVSDAMRTQLRRRLDGIDTDMVTPMKQVYYRAMRMISGGHRDLGYYAMLYHEIEKFDAARGDILLDNLGSDIRGTHGTRHYDAAHATIRFETLYDMLAETHNTKADANARESIKNTLTAMQEYIERPNYGEYSPEESDRLAQLVVAALNQVAEHSDGLINKAAVQTESGSSDRWYITSPRYPIVNDGQSIPVTVHAIRRPGMGAGIEMPTSFQRLQGADVDGDKVLVQSIPLDSWKEAYKSAYEGLDWEKDGFEKARRMHINAAFRQSRASSGLGLYDENYIEAEAKLEDSIVDPAITGQANKGFSTANAVYSQAFSEKISVGEEVMNSLVDSIGKSLTDAVSEESKLNEIISFSDIAMKAPDEDRMILFSADAKNVYGAIEIDAQDQLYLSSPVAGKNGAKYRLGFGKMNRGGRTAGVITLFKIDNTNLGYKVEAMARVDGIGVENLRTGLSMHQLAASDKNQDEMSIKDIFETTILSKFPNAGDIVVSRPENLRAATIGGIVKQIDSAGTSNAKSGGNNVIKRLFSPGDRNNVYGGVRDFAGKLIVGYNVRITDVVNEGKDFLTELTRVNDSDADRYAMAAKKAARKTASIINQQHKNFMANDRLLLSADNAQLLDRVMSNSTTEPAVLKQALTMIREKGLDELVVGKKRDPHFSAHYYDIILQLSEARNRFDEITARDVVSHYIKDHPAEDRLFFDEINIGTEEKPFMVNENEMVRDVIRMSMLGRELYGNVGSTAAAQIYGDKLHHADIFYEDVKTVDQLARKLARIAESLDREVSIDDAWVKQELSQLDITAEMGPVFNDKILSQLESIRANHPEYAEKAADVVIKEAINSGEISEYASQKLKLRSIKNPDKHTSIDALVYRMNEQLKKTPQSSGLDASSPMEIRRREALYRALLDTLGDDLKIVAYMRMQGATDQFMRRALEVLPKGKNTMQYNEALELGREMFWKRGRSKIINPEDLSDRSSQVLSNVIANINLKGDWGC